LIASSLGAFYAIIAQRLDIKINVHGRPQNEWASPIKQILLNPCMRPSFAVPQFDPAIPKENLKEWAAFEEKLYGEKIPSRIQDSNYAIFSSIDERFAFKDFFDEKYGSHRKTPSDDGRDGYSIMHDPYMHNSIMMQGSHIMDRASLEIGLKEATSFFDELQKRDIIYLPKGESRKEYLENLKLHEKRNGNSNSDFPLPEIVEW
ncbi:MAG: hypothetical protein K5839_05395, partial [Treponemataceae bacterium]|nr:hypothetical protein [Treponemataceae bacterium]